MILEMITRMTRATLFGHVGWKYSFYLKTVILRGVGGEVNRTDIIGIIIGFAPTSHILKQYRVTFGLNRALLRRGLKLSFLVGIRSGRNRCFLAKQSRHEEERVITLCLSNLARGIV